MENQETNNLKHTISINDTQNNIKIDIRLNDECKNGHQDFSITGDYWEVGKLRSHRSHVGCGCIHEEILRAIPDLKLFVNLHLCDYKGVPMYAVANGFYHLREGFNDSKPTNANFKSKFCEYYRVTEEQFNQLVLCESETRYAIKLKTLGILEQWEQEAKKAISLLEQWTNKKFIVDSKKSQYVAPTDEQIKEEEKREKEGYYTIDKIKEREEAKKQETIRKQYEKIAEERDSDISKANIEYEIKKLVLDEGLSFKNFIYYNHSKEGCFNWNDCEKRTTKEQFEKFQNSITVQEFQLKHEISFKLKGV